MKILHREAGQTKNVDKSHDKNLEENKEEKVGFEELDYNFRHKAQVSAMKLLTKLQGKADHHQNSTDQRVKRLSNI